MANRPPRPRWPHSFPTASHDAVNKPTTESLTQWAYALNCVNCKTNNGYIKIYNDGKDFLSCFDKNYADIVIY